MRGVLISTVLTKPFSDDDDIIRFILVVTNIVVRVLVATQLHSITKHVRKARKKDLNSRLESSHMSISVVSGRTVTV